MKADERLLEDLLDAIRSQLSAEEGLDSNAIRVELDPVYEDPGEVLAKVLRAIYGWCERWLEDPQHDALRARGDPKWEAINGLQQAILRALDFVRRKA